jgi:hypothetical protein
MSHDGLRVVEAGFDILAREFRVGGEQLFHVGIFSQTPEDMFDRNPRAAHDGLANHDLGVGYDAVIVIKLFFVHVAYLAALLYHRQVIDRQPLFRPQRLEATGGKKWSTG